MVLILLTAWWSFDHKSLFVEVEYRNIVCPNEIHTQICSAMFGIISVLTDSCDLYMFTSEKALLQSITIVGGVIITAHVWCELNVTLQYAIKCYHSENTIPSITMKPAHITTKVIKTRVIPSINQVCLNDMGKTSQFLTTRKHNNALPVV